MEDNEAHAMEHALTRELQAQIAMTPGGVIPQRGSGGEEKVLKNAKDTCAAEALEIATHGARAPGHRGRR